MPEFRVKLAAITYNMLDSKYCTVHTRAFAVLQAALQTGAHDKRSRIFRDQSGWSLDEANEATPS